MEPRVVPCPGPSPVPGIRGPYPTTAADPSAQRRAGAPSVEAASARLPRRAHAPPHHLLSGHSRRCGGDSPVSAIERCQRGRRFGGNVSRPDLPPRRHADEWSRRHPVSGRRRGAPDPAARGGGGRHGRRGLSGRERGPCPLPRGALGLRRALPEGVGADPPTAALRGAGVACRAFAQSTAPGSGDDFAQMRALGFNVVRLVLNWSQLEPTAGTYSATYLDRVAQVVGWARQQGIYVILDMHQDQYSRYIVPAKKGTLPPGARRRVGATALRPGPCRTTASQPAPCSASTSSTRPSPPPSPTSGRTPPSPARRDRRPARASGSLHRRPGRTGAAVPGNAAVLGYELMNEPQPGSIGSTPAGNGYQASSQDLYPFYTRAIEALTGVRDGRPTCPAGTRPRSRTRAPTRSWRRSTGSRSSSSRSPTGTWWTSRSRCPHLSRPTPTSCSRPMCTPTRSPLSRTCWDCRPSRAGTRPTSPSGTRRPNPRRRRCTRPCCVTEFGDSVKHRYHHPGQRARRAGGDGDRRHPVGLEGTVQGPRDVLVHCAGSTRATRRRPTGRPARAIRSRCPSSADLLIPSRQRLLMRVSPEATAGRLGAYSYDPATRTFAMVATSTEAGRRGDRQTDTVIAIPSERAWRGARRAAPRRSIPS